MSVEEYLKKKYGYCKKLKNGNYYVKTKDNTEIYVPKDFQPSTKVFAYIPGAGGPGKDAENIRRKMEGTDPDNYVVVIAPTSYDKTKILDQAHTIITDNNSQVSGVVVSGFSMGARQTYVSLADYLTKHPELADSSACIMTDGWVTNYKREDLQIIRDNAIPILYVTGATTTMQNGANKLWTITKNLATNGFNVIAVRSHDYGHGGFNRDVISNGFAQFLLGDRDDIGNVNVNTSNQKLAPRYEFYVWNAEKRKFELIVQIGDGTDFTKLDFIRVDLSNVFLI